MLNTLVHTGYEYTLPDADTPADLSPGSFCRLTLGRVKMDVAARKKKNCMKIYSFYKVLLFMYDSVV